MEPQDIPYQLLEEITNGFAEERKLGQGGYGTVYEGFYNEKEIAVKRLNSNPTQSEEQFLKEFGNIASLKHKNIVGLVGFCYESKGKATNYNGRLVIAEQPQRALCFEYMCNKSLQNHLSDKCDKLDWHTSYRIIKGICEGLRYLHERPQPILHLDLKPDNILLDKNMVAKLADFGLSKIIEGEQSVMTLNFTGTLYMPPEFRSEQKRNKEYDIFSLGVVIIEVVTGPSSYNNIAANFDGKPAEQLPAQQFIESAVEKWRRKLQVKWSCSMLQEYCEQVKVCMEIALECLEKHSHKRPDIESIINRLIDKETEADKAEVLEETICFNTSELRFPLNDCSEEERARTLQLINKSESYVASKIVPPKNISVSRELVAVPPNSIYTLFILPDESRVSIEGTDDNNLYVHSKKINKEACVTDELFTNVAADSIDTAVIKCVFLHEELPGAQDVQPGVKIKVPFDYSLDPELTITILQMHSTQPWLLFALSKNDTPLLAALNYEAETQSEENFIVPAAGIDAAKFLEDDQCIVASHSSGSISVFKYTGMKTYLIPLKTFKAHSLPIISLAIPPRGQYLLTADVGGAVKQWGSGFVHVLQFDGHSDAVNEVKIKPDQPYIFATASRDGTLKIWNLLSHKPDAVLVGHSAEVTCVDFFIGKSWVISGSRDKTLKIWDYERKACLQTLEDTHTIRAVCCHPKLPLIFSGLEDGTVRLRNSNTYSLENSFASFGGRVCSIDRQGSGRVTVAFVGTTMILETNSDEEAPHVSAGDNAGTEMPHPGASMPRLMQGVDQRPHSVPVMALKYMSRSMLQGTRKFLQKGRRER